MAREKILITISYNLLLSLQVSKTCVCVCVCIRTFTDARTIKAFKYLGSSPKKIAVAYTTRSHSRSEQVRIKEELHEERSRQGSRINQSHA